MVTVEVVVAIAFGFPALIMAAVALYLQWVLRSRHARGTSITSYTEIAHVAAAWENHLQWVYLLIRETGDEEHVQGLTRFFHRAGLDEFPGDLPVAREKIADTSFRYSVSIRQTSSHAA